MNRHVKKGQAPEPPLLSLQGRVDHQALEDAVAGIQGGAYPGWRVVSDARTGGARGWGHTLAALAGSVFGMFNQPSSAPGRAIVVEHAPTGRQETVRFDYLGEANGAPLWSRG